MSAIENFTKGIKILIDTAIKKAPYDATYQGIIKDITDENVYTVTINGKDYAKTTTLTDKALSIGDIVKVVFPQNNASLRYILNAGSGSGGGEVATSYSQLDDKPKINNVELIGNKSLSALGAVSTDDFDNLSNDVSTNTNDIYQNTLDIADLISDKYDKTGGNISGDVDIDGALKLNIEDEDYDVDIRFERRLDANRGTILTPKGYVSGTQYKVAIENVGTPVNNYDAVNKKYVDDMCSIVWIIGIYDQGELVVTSDAYDRAYEAVSGDKTCYMKITEAGQVSVMRLKAWIDFNNHKDKQDSFLFADCVDNDTNKQVLLTATSATFTTTDLEHLENKVSSWCNIPDDTHYPTEKLTKDTIDALRAYVDDKYGAHVLWQVAADNGLEATETKARTTSWQLEGIDMTPYKYVLAYIRACKGSNADQEGASLVIRIDLDANMMAPRSGRYVGGIASIYPNDNGVKYMVSAVVDDTKTKFAFNYCMANTTGTTALDRDGKCWKLEGYKA